MEYGALCLIPPIIAVGVSFLTKQVIPSLILALFSAGIISSDFNIGMGFITTLESVATVFTKSTRYNILAFSTIGIFTTLLNEMGAFSILAEKIAKVGIKNKKAVQISTALIGSLLFMASSVSILTTGAVVRPLADKYKLSSEKSSFLLDATGAPVCSLTLIGPWGALLMGLLAAQGIANDAGTAFGAIRYNFYAIAMYLFMWFTIVTGKDFGPMKKAEERASLTGEVVVNGNESDSKEIVQKAKSGANIFDAFIPLGVLIGSVVYFLWVTGKGNIFRGSGGKSFVYACTLSIIVTLAMMAFQKLIDLKTATSCITKGVSKMTTVIVIIVLAVALGNLVKGMHTGQYLAHFTKDIMTASLLPAAIFVLSCLMSFATGTSYGTMGIMIPIGIPMASAMGLNFEVITGAVLAGAVFGDQCSPISDTTIISAMAAGANLLDHVKTQMVYAFFCAAVAFFGYIILGYTM